jgi:hypothetical protein
MANLQAVKHAIMDIGFECVTVAQIRQIVYGVRGKRTHPKQSRSVVKVAIEHLLAAIEGTDTLAPASDADLADWLEVLFKVSPRAADLMGAALVRLEPRARRAA